MNGSQIRQRFLEHFARRDHLVLPSAPLVLPRDPTTLFTSAGMQPLKPYYQGLEEPPAPKLTSCQKCFRTPDLEEVGRTDRHSTFLEMLGNFAPTGAYFKAGAIPLAWELVTEGFGLPVDRLRVTVHPTDDEAREIWLRQPGLRPDWVYRNEENWWAAGDTGPCGPDSELWYDRGREHGCGQPDCPPDHCDRFLEFWNLVFMQYDRQPDGSLPPLPQPGIDTGMGVDRIASILEGVDSIFETDLWRPIVAAVERSSQKPNRVSVRVVADHVRSMTFVIADGVRPANEGRGYILRRLIRRAALHARRLELRDPLRNFVPVVVGQMHDAYPELDERQPVVQEVVEEESERFGRVLEQGVERFEELVSRQAGKIPGDEAFKLHDTFGFPLEMTQELARERGLEVDVEAFDAAMAGQRARSRGMSGQRWLETRGSPPTQFVGYASTEGAAVVTALAREGESVPELRPGESGEVWLDQTPFYAESGGQIGDSGRLESDAASFAVEDTQLAGPGSIAHHGRQVTGSLHVGDRVQARVDAERRHQIARHHSATHLLHRALTEVLEVPGPLQRGSWVGPDRTTFDFALTRALTPAEVARINRLISEHVRQGLPLRVQEMRYPEAVKTGAMHLFEEKYGDVVRVVCFGDWTCEFCGGTHVESTADVGPALVVSEQSIGAGLRRIELVAGTAADDLVERRLDEVGRAARALGTAPGTVAERVDELRRQVQESERRLQRTQAELRRARLQGGNGSPVHPVEGTRIPALMEVVEADTARDLGGYADSFLEALAGSGVVAVTSGDSYVIKVSRDLSGDFDANRLKAAFGRGGGQAWFVQGRLERPPEEAFARLKEMLS